MTHPEPASRQAGSRALILDAARQELADRGYESATVRSIARRAGVDPGLIRHYFRGKPELVREALDFELLLAQLGDRIGAHSGNAPLGRELYQLTRFWDAEPMRWQALVASSMTAEPEVRTAFAALIDHMAAALSEDSGGTGSQDARLRAELAVGAVLGLWVTQRVLRQSDQPPWATLEDMATGGLDQLLDGSGPGSS